MSQTGAEVVTLDDFGITEAWEGPCDTFESRRHRCYELTAFTLLYSHEVPAEAVLVHGSIDGHQGFGRIGHAWLALPLVDDAEWGMVTSQDCAWEPISASVINNWTPYADARVEHTYTRDEVAALLDEHGHYGPWVPSLFR